MNLQGYFFSNLLMFILKVINIALVGMLQFLIYLQ